MNSTSLAFLFAAFATSTAAVAQCLPPQQVYPPFTVPVSAGTWSIQHFGQPLAAGAIDYVIVSLPAAVPIPMAALPGLFCNTVGNMGANPCLYTDLGGIVWLALGPSPGQNVTVTINWPNNPALAGTLFLAQFGVAGCAGPGPDSSVLICGQLQ